METITRRILTLKSKIKFGKYPDLCVGELINMRNFKDLLSMYYKLSKIDFNQEVKDILNITKNIEIEKPGTNISLYNENVYHLICLCNNKINNNGFEGAIIVNKRKKSIKEKRKVIDWKNESKIRNRNLNMKKK
jgi:hypothetical protein